MSAAEAERSGTLVIEAKGVSKSFGTTPIVSGAAVLYAAVYLVLAFRRAYDAPPLKAIVRTAAVGVTYAMVVLATLLAIAVPVIFRR